MSNAGHMLNRLLVQLFPSARRQVWARLLCNGQYNPDQFDEADPTAYMGNFLHKRSETAMLFFYYHENVMRYLWVCIFCIIEKGGEGGGGKEEGEGGERQECTSNTDHRKVAQNNRNGNPIIVPAW